MKDKKPGEYSLAEIVSQPQCWQECLQKLQGEGVLERIQREFAGAEEWLFVGCGSSYYVAIAAAASWSTLSGLRARAIPASELVLQPALALAGTKRATAVLISRSGRTSEVLQAGEILKKKNIRTLVVTCATGQALEQFAEVTLATLPADENSTVMTRSFTSMLLGLQLAAAQIGGRKDFAGSLGQMAGEADRALQAMQPRIKDFVASHQFSDYVCLGQGHLYGLACESTLKLTEMSVSYGQCFHTLEFRHGPKSIVSPETLIVFLLSESSYEAECEVLEEIKGLGGTTLAVCNRADRRARDASDLLIEFGFAAAELARLAAYAFAGQLLGLYTGLKKGLDPDRPRNLSRVVILDDKEGTGKPEHAAI